MLKSHYFLRGGRLPIVWFVKTSHSFANSSLGAHFSTWRIWEFFVHFWTKVKAACSVYGNIPVGCKAFEKFTSRQFVNRTKIGRESKTLWGWEFWKEACIKKKGSGETRDGHDSSHPASSKFVPHVQTLLWTLTLQILQSPWPLCAFSSCGLKANYFM